MRYRAPTGLVGVKLTQVCESASPVLESQLSSRANEGLSHAGQLGVETRHLPQTARAFLAHDQLVPPPAKQQHC